MSLEAQDKTGIPDIKGNIGAYMQEENMANLKEQPINDGKINKEQVPDALEKYLVKNQLSKLL